MILIPAMNHPAFLAGTFTFAEEGGLIEYLADPGDVVQAGQPVARISPTGRSGAAPATLSLRRSGLLTARHFPGENLHSTAIFFTAERLILQNCHTNLT